MLSDQERAQICDRIAGEALDKLANVFTEGAVRTIRGGLGVVGDAGRGYWRALTGKSRDAITGELKTMKALKESIEDAAYDAPDTAARLKRQRDAARAKQVLGVGGLGAGTWQAAKGANAHEEYMRGSYGIRP